MIPRRVKSATLLAVALHGFFILTASYRQSYDAFNHMFFADHYRLDWWSLWEPRWYTGFEVISYPPLIHQIIAFLGHFIGVDAGFALVLWVVLAAYPLAVYRFSHIFTGRTTASLAAIGAALLPSLFLTGHVFGQLPSLAATLLALFGAAVLADYLYKGSALCAFAAVSIFAASISTHHATLLFLPWIVLAVTLHFIFEHKIHLRALSTRLFVFICAVTLSGYLVVLPFWQWGARQVLQTPIDHASRHNFFQDPLAMVLFFLPMYGLLLLVVPLAIKMGLQKRYMPVGIPFLFLFLLGLGGTTPLPKLFLGRAWEWMTYDRFSFWASLFLLPFFGITAVVARQKFPALIKHSLASGQVRQWANQLLFVLMSFIVLLIGSISSWLPTQPPLLDMQPIVEFLDYGDRSYWRYVTFGFGDQFAYLSRLTKATTIDGSYHTARALPELRNSGIGQIDTAFWIPGGMTALAPILQKSGERGVRWGFVNLKDYDPVLARNGWRQVATLANGVEVWENPSAVLPPQVIPPEATPFATFAWGTFPLLSLFFSGVFSLRQYNPGLSRTIFSNLITFASGLLPMSLAFWYYRRLFAVPYERIYFTYTDPLFFISDGLALLIVFFWLLNKTAKATWKPFQWRLDFYSPGSWLFIICLLATISILWSLDWRISLYYSLHLWVVYGLYQAFKSTPKAWRWFAIGSGAALMLQVTVGTWQFLTQSTAFSMALNLDWPGELLPSMSGASVVQFLDGTRWLRAYGTFPHPNLLGGWVLASLACILAYLLASKRGNFLLLLLFNTGLALLAITFSRAAWLGFGVSAGVLLLHSRNLDRRKLSIVFFSGLLCLGLTFLPLRSFVAARLAEPQAQTEKVSSYTRLWLLQRTWEIIQQRPILGVGAGSYSLALAQHVEKFYEIEPVHNLPFLVWSELGIAGLLALSGLTFTILVGLFKARRPVAVSLSAALLGLLVIGLFDHYLWTLAPGRLLFGTLLGLRAGQVIDERGG